MACRPSIQPRGVSVPCEVADRHWLDPERLKLATAAGPVPIARARFDALFDEVAHRTLREQGAWRLSMRALQAALFINLYRDEPALQLPFRLLSLLMDIDELPTTWRYRHALMVQRIIGLKVGTGGSSGHNYLRRTAETTQRMA
jgi:tryptophan 2,3-dioxygenase